MRTITLRTVPDDVHARLKQRARERGMTLNAFMIDLFQRSVECPEEELAARIASHSRPKRR